MSFLSENHLAEIPMEEKTIYPNFKYYAAEDHTIRAKIKMKRGDEISPHELLKIQDTHNLELLDGNVYTSAGDHVFDISLTVRKNLLFNGANFTPDYENATRWKAHEMLYNMQICSKQVADSVLENFEQWLQFIDDYTFGISNEKFEYSKGLEYYEEMLIE